MDALVQSLTVNASPSFAKKTVNISSRNIVTVELKDTWFPASLHINKKSKCDFILDDNGCIPDILKRESFSINSAHPWLYAKAISFSLPKKINEEKNNSKMGSPTSTEIIPLALSDLSNYTNFVNFLKCELSRNLSLCLRVGMRICVKYLTQEYLLDVERITPSYYDFSNDTIHSDVSFKCYQDTDVSITDKEVHNNDKNLNFDGFGGYKKELDDLKEKIDNFFQWKKTVSGILINGMSGVGKSFIGDILQSVYGDKCRVLNSEDITSSYVSEAEITIKKEFQQAQARAPSIVFIDNIDEICSSRDQNVHTAGVVNAFLYLMDGIHHMVSKGLLVIATATYPETLDQALRRPGRLSHDISLPVPHELDRLDILKCLWKNSSSSPAPQDILPTIAAKTSGFVAADLMSLITESFNLSREKFPTIEHFSKALEIIKPSALKKVATLSKKVAMEDLSGYEETKTSLLTTCELSVHRRQLFLANGITCPSRILLFGPSGCGKSMMVHAIATYFSLVVIPVRRSSIFGKYFGESEKNLDLLFQQAKQSSPCILHFENFDGVAGRRSKNSEVSSDVEDRVINHLKVLLDGVVGYENILVFAETNRPDLLDKDVIRHGRFHKYIYIDLPSKEDRRCVLEKSLIHTVFRNRDPGKVIEDLVDKTEGFSVAEILVVCRDILCTLIEESTESSNRDLDSSWDSTVDETLEAVLPRTSTKLKKKYEQFSTLYCIKL